MGIYIKGIKTPAIVKVHYLNGRRYVEDPQSREWREMVDIPPHGRLGDLDALAKQIEHDRFHHTHTDSLAAQHHVAEYGHFLKAIIDAPAIIPAEEEEA